VRSADGLVGRVIETGRWGSRVLLVGDGASNVPVRLVRNGTAAIATGHGDGTIDLKTLELGENPFRRGDVLVTSGVGGVYPPDIPVAVVVSVAGDRTVAKPLADPANVEYAVVLNVYQPLADVPLSEATESALRGAGQ
jgi:rod shape-determining protein MreC